MDIFTFITNGEDWDQDLYFLFCWHGLTKTTNYLILTYFIHYIGSKHRLSMIDTKLDFLAEKKTLHILDKGDFFGALQEYLSLYLKYSSSKLLNLEAKSLQNLTVYIYASRNWKIIQNFVHNKSKHDEPNFWNYSN